jgi:signal transduction histidine kinase/ActR/RegA family two-component response regulator
LFDGGRLLAVLIAALVFFGGLVGLGANADRLARLREQAQAANALQGAIQEAADQVFSQANWDTALEHASNKIDMPWVVENVGSFLSQPGRFRFVYLIDPTGHAVFAMDHGQDVAPKTFAGITDAAAPLVREVRAREAQRGPFAGRSQNKQMISKAIQASSIIRHDGELFILTATLIQPDFGTVLPTGSRASIIVTGKAIDAAFLQAFGNRLLLRNVHLVAPDHRAGAYIGLSDEHGGQLARISWSPEHPGADLITVAFLPILLGVSIPLALYLRGEQTARRLRATLAELALARDQADTANRHKSQFLANMSHEIRTPLNGIMAMAQVMTLHRLAPDQSQRLSVINRSSETLLALLNDILDIAKIEAGHLELEQKAFDLGTLAEGVRALFTPIAAQKGLDFQVDVSPEARGVWVGDEDRLRQIIANLVNNALKFTAAGHVHVRILATHEDGLRVIVRDTGIGLPPDKLESIFDSFSQADASTARRFGGTGLGLTICRQLLEAMGGRLWAESEEGVGSVFQLIAPLARLKATPETATQAQSEGAMPRERLNILAADDNVTNRQVLAAILEQLGIDLTLCEDGQQALSAWRAGGYDLILMDIQMPVLDGVSATQRIRAEEASAERPRTPIIALTANAMPHQLAEYRAAGLDDCVVKPIRITELHNAIARALSVNNDDATRAA